MDFEAIDTLRDRHAAWRLLRAGNASLILSFLGDFFVEGNRGSCSASEVAAALDDHLYALNAEIRSAATARRDIPRTPRAYLEDWAAAEAGYLRRFYPPGDDEVHYEVTPAFEKAYGWVLSLKARPFVGTESRLHTAVELLAADRARHRDRPRGRLAELRRRRDEIDAEIAAVEAGRLTVLDPTGVRDRYQQFTATARELLRTSGRSRRTSGAWTAPLGRRSRPGTGPRASCSPSWWAAAPRSRGSDQGRSFQSFYDFLLSESRQAELTELLASVGCAGRHRARSADPRHPPRLVRGGRARAAHRAADLRAAAPLPRRPGLAGEPAGAGPGAGGRARGARAPRTPPDVGLEVDEPGIDDRAAVRAAAVPTPAAVAVESLIPPDDRGSGYGSAVHPDLHRPGPPGRQHPRRCCRSAPRRCCPTSSRCIPSSRARPRSSATSRSTTTITVEMDESDETVLEYADPADRDLVTAGPAAEGDGAAPMRADEHAVGERDHPADAGSRLPRVRRGHLAHLGTARRRRARPLRHHRGRRRRRRRRGLRLPPLPATSRGRGGRCRAWCGGGR